MKIVQSLWSLPGQSLEMEEGRSKGGWLSQEFHHMSLALSCLLLRRHHDNVELITDAAGYDLLIKRFNLPYTNVRVCLDDLNHYPAGLWALPKLYSYSIQEEPFLHVDGDVFTWAPLKTLRTQDYALVAQSPELYHHETYLASLLHIHQILPKLPNYFSKYIDGKHRINSINAGVIGGSDLDFIKIYSNTALKFIYDNLLVLKQDSRVGLVNIVVEQLLFAELAQEHGKSLSYILPELGSDFNEAIQFSKVPFGSNFIHLIGQAKRSVYSCEQVKCRLQYEFPLEFARIQKASSAIASWRYFLPIGPADSPIREVEMDVALLKSIDVITDETGDLVHADLLKVTEAAAALLQRHPHGCESINGTYDLMNRLNKEDLLGFPVSLSSNCYIIELSNEGVSSTLEAELDDETKYLIVQNRGGRALTQKLVGWSEFLIYFQGKSLSGNELIDIFVNEDAELSFEFLKDAVHDLLCSHLIYTGYLVPGSNY